MQKSKRKSKSDAAGRGPIQWISTGRMILFMASLFGMFILWFNSRPLPDRIAMKFSMTLPQSARDFGWFDYIWNGYVTLAKFTVDYADLDATMQSVQWDSNRCISRPRERGYMPDFYVPAGQDWWQPYDALKFEGVTCSKYDAGGQTDNFNIMVDYTTPGAATVYIEEYSVDAQGRRALQEGN